MRLLILMTVIFQNGINAVQNQPPDLLELHKEQELLINSLQTTVLELMDENKNFKRQINGLINSKVVLLADIDKIASQNEKIASETDKIASETDKIASQTDKIASRTDKIASLSDKIDIMQEKLNREFTIKQNELTSKIYETAASVAEIKNTPKTVVAFRATCAKNFPNSESIKKFENPVIWKNVEYNIGSAFDASNGKFTCPHDGIYSFYATSPIKGQYYGGINIHVNGSVKVVHFLRNPYRMDHDVMHTEYKNVSPQGVFKLSKGDTVDISMLGTFHHASSYCDRTYFQGHLIDLL